MGSIFSPARLFDRFQKPSETAHVIPDHHSSRASGHIGRSLLSEEGIGTICPKQLQHAIRHEWIVVTLSELGMIGIRISLV